MPEIKHQFSSGRMNLDLDERLVPNGEYREAFNIQVSSSEGSNVGVLQNLLSNEEVNGQQGVLDHRLYTYECIGSVSDEKNDALYWFVRPHWYKPHQQLDFFEGTYNNSPPFNVGSGAVDTFNLWQWKQYSGAAPGSTSMAVETTIGRDMIIEYRKGNLSPVLVDHFEVICGVNEGYYELPPIVNNYPIEYGSLRLAVDLPAYNSIQVGWELSGFTRSVDTHGNSPILVATGNIVVTKKFKLAGRNYIELQDTTTSTGSDFDGLINNIVAHNVGPAGKLKAFYFKNPKPSTNFRFVRHITGVNIIDDMLFWTDDYNEPKKINILRSKRGTTSTGDYHTRLLSEIDMAQPSPTQFPGIPIKEEHITVIKKSPNNPLALELVTGREERSIFDSGNLYYESYTGVITTGANPGTQTDDIININGNTTIQTFGSLQVGDQFKVKVYRDAAGHSVFASPIPHYINWKWQIGDVVVLKEFDETNTNPPSLPLTDYTIKGTIDLITGNTNSNIPGFNSIPGSIAEVVVTVTSINGTPPVANANAGNTTGELQYVIDKFDQDKNIFEFKYPRFGYRYKYEDGEYSHFSPFTEPAFVPGGFDYHPKKGYNLGMVNRIEHIVVKNFVPDNIPLDVVEVDILYKDDSSPMIYVVDTLSPEDDRKLSKPSWCSEPLSSATSSATKYNYWQLNSYKITDEQIKYILPENQLLRIYDNVPRKALAQEITGNRIVYANYLQNFDLLTNTGDKFYPEFDHHVKDYDLEYGNNKKDRSIKSLREYQLGVVFIDEFGRETPVLTTSHATFKVPKALADNNNRLSVGMKFEPPSGYFAKMEYFKFCIKETSGEWYNMAMDRWYDAADGNVWMSFPSADRDKLNIDDFLILKKAVDTNDPVLQHPARYKVLAIENEAPEYIKRTFTLVDYRSHNNSLFNTGTIDIPRSGVSTFELQFAVLYNTHCSNLHEQFLAKGVDDFYVQFEESEETSKKYRISSITSDIQYDLTSGNPTNLSSAKYYIKTAQVLNEDVNMILDDPTNLNPTGIKLTAKMRLFRMKPESKPEFDGRFFVKIFTDDIFDQYVKSSYDPSQDIEYIVSARVQLSYMNEQHHLMHEGDGTWRDSGSNSYHAGTGFPTERFPCPIRRITTGPGSSTQMNEADSFFWANNAYSNARYTNKFDDNGMQVKLGLRHFAPYFRKYTHSQNPTSAGPMVLSFPGMWNGQDGHGLMTHFYIPNTNTDSSIGLVGDLFDMADFDPLYKFEYGSSGDDIRWREEYNNYTTIPHKSFYPIKYLGSFGSSPFNLSTLYPSSNYPQHSPLDAPYNIPESQLLWDSWWRSDEYRKKSDNKARDTEVWYINKGFVAGKEYYTNDKKLGTSTYGAQQGRGILIGSTKIYLEISLGGLWGEPKTSMDGATNAQMIDPGFFDIGKPGGNASYQDAPTMAIVSNLTPGTFCRFKEDPFQTMYQVVGVTENNYVNYARFEKDDEGGWWLDSIANDSNYTGTISQYFTGEREIYYPITDLNNNVWHGDHWGHEVSVGTTTAADYEAVVGLHMWNDGPSYVQGTEIGLWLSNTWDPTGTPSGNPQGKMAYVSWTKNNSFGSQLSCNWSKSWRLELINVNSSNPNDMPWDPTGGTAMSHGPIANGVEIDITVATGTGSTGDLTTTPYSFTTSSIVNSNGDVLKNGMIVVSYDAAADTTFEVEFDKNIASDSDHLSLLYLQVVNIDEISTGQATTYRVELGGYMRPLTVNDTYTFADDSVIKFKQAIMNGYSPNSVHKISANTIFSGDFDTQVVGGTLEATEYTLEFLQRAEDDEVPLSTNPAIWETEPKDGPDLDIYYEASPRIPLELSQENANDWIPTRYSWNPDLSFNSYSRDSGQAIHNPKGSHENSVILTGTLYPGTFFAPTPEGNHIEIVHVDGDILTLRCDGYGEQDRILGAIAPSYNGPLVDPDPTVPRNKIRIRRPDGIIFTAEVLAHNVAAGTYSPLTPQHTISDAGVLQPNVDITDPSFGVGPENSLRIKINKGMYGGTSKKSNSKIDLNWHNCYAFGNGVESDRIRDNFNTPFISNGVRVSTTLSDYEQERRDYGLIYSGIYNSISGVNSLNQFIQAEKITKDVNPSYGSIQRLYSRDSDLVTFCEDKVLKILANKDAVYNADGNPQLTANINVLGQTIPFSGEYGISKNPESFASENYRAYFADKVRGAVLRLSKDGLTPISDAGMHDWFKDNLKRTDFILGSYDDEKQEYNVTLKNSVDHVPEWTSLAYYVAPQNNISSGKGVVVSYDERVKGWVSFKSFGAMESGASCANKYYTFKDGILFKHHIEDQTSSNSRYNTFYEESFKSQINILLNDEPSIVKSFKTISYEGSQAKVPLHTAGSGQYNDFTTEFGWYSNAMNTNMDEGSEIYFIEKEGKWFSRIKGANESSTIDTSSFANQGLGFLGNVTLP
jgi:hypothetical protein